MLRALVRIVNIRRALVWSLFALSCAPGTDTPSASAGEDERIASRLPDELFADFFDGKFDGAGHPIGATVFEADDACAPATGRRSGDSTWIVEPSKHAAGVICGAATARLGRGQYTASLRVALDEPLRDCEASECPEVFRVQVVADSESTEGDAPLDENILSERVFRTADFLATSTWLNLVTEFSMFRPGPVRIRVVWEGEVRAQLDYVEVFRRSHQLVLSPGSGLLDAAATFRVEVIDPAEGAEVTIRCNDVDLSDRLRAFVEAGVATEERTEFRHILSAPAEQLFEGCGPYRTVVVETGQRYTDATSEVRYLPMEPACAFTEDGRQRVLLTGFVPFPAGARSVNSSSLAVDAFDAESVPEATVMRLVLPVEYEAAAAIVRDTIARCRPDVVVGFGQGRRKVDLETTGYNRRDTSEVPGGVPDNRGVIVDGAPIRPDGPDTVSTQLPIGDIEARLSALSIDVGFSDDPGRYVCNDLFYTLASSTQQSAELARTRVGFVHLPRIFSPSDEDIAMLRTVVREVVSASLY